MQRKCLLLKFLSTKKTTGANVMSGAKPHNRVMKLRLNYNVKTQTPSSGAKCSLLYTHTYINTVPILSMLVKF